MLTKQTNKQTNAHQIIREDAGENVLLPTFLSLVKFVKMKRKSPDRASIIKKEYTKVIK